MATSIRILDEAFKYQIFLNTLFFPLIVVKAKIARKEWYPILAPKLFQNAVLGETYVYEPQEMVGKGIVSNLMSLTNDIKRQNINISFRVNSVENGKAFADVIGYYMLNSSIRRMVRRDIEKIDMSFSCKTSDNKTLQVKPLFIARSATKGSVAAKIRRIAQDSLIRYISSVTYDTFVNDLVSHKVQTSLKNELSKVYPLRVCEIRYMGIVDLERKLAAKAKEQQGKKSEEARAKKKERRAKEGKEAEKKEAREERSESAEQQA